jgi:uncharacterized BrkB/YihY/UPF0761 family membrane protein
MDRKTLRALFITSLVLLAVSIFLVPLYNYLDDFSSKKVEYMFIGATITIFLTGVVMLSVSLYYEREMQLASTRNPLAKLNNNNNAIENMMS